LAALVRLALIAVAAVVVYFLVIKPIRANWKPRIQRAPPLCTRCESGRNVVANNDNDPKYPKGEYAWYCKACLEGFNPKRMV